MPLPSPSYICNWPFDAIAITGVSPALAKSLLEEAKSQAKWIGIKHLEIETSELNQTSYNENPKDRCYACKKELHKHTTYISKKLNYNIVLDGVNFDDLKDYLKHGSRKRLRKNINNKKIVSKDKEKQYELKLYF